MTVAAYGAATLVAWSRVHDEAHWPSDVVAGALTGTTMSLTTIGWLERREATRQPGARAGTTGRAEPASGDRTPSARIGVGPAAIMVTVRF